MDWRVWIIRRPDGSFFVSDIQDYFEYILKKQGEKKSDHPSIEIYINKTEKKNYV